MNTMVERRRSKRRELNVKLLVKRLDSDLRDELDISVLNVSKSGIGFTSDELLDIGAVYESYLTIWTKEVIHCFIEIIRIEIKADCFEYGGIFIGMPDSDLQRIEVYNMVEDAYER